MEEILPFKKQALRNTIAKNIQTFHSGVPTWSWTGDVPEVNIDSIFVDKVDLRGTKRLENYRDILKKSEDDTMNGKRFILTGDAGVGKETLARRILMDWSQLVLRPYQFAEEFRYLSEYRYTIPVFCSSIATSEDIPSTGFSLQKIIENQLELTSEHADLLLELVRREPESSLFVIIGYGNHVAEKSEQLRRLANRTEQSLSKVHCLITCRSYTLGMLPEPDRDEHIELHGFDPFGPEEYIETFSSMKMVREDSKHELKMLIRSERENDLRLCSKTPALLLLICTLWSGGRKLANTMTGLYMEFLRYMCGRYERNLVSRSRRTSEKELLNKYMDPILELSLLAERGLILNGLETSFPEEYVKDKLSDLALQLGFLTSGKTKYLSKIMQFHHRTMQEFFIALGIVYSTSGDGMRTLMNLCSGAERLSNARIILAFVCGLSHAMSYRVKALIEGELDRWQGLDKVNSPTYRVDFLIRLAGETSARFSLPEIIILDPAEFKPRSLRRFFSMDGDHVQEIILTNITRISEISFLENLHYARLDSLEIRGSSKHTYMFGEEDSPDMAVAHPGTVIKYLYPKAIKFRCFNDTEGLIRTIRGLRNASDLKVLSCTDCYLGSDGINAVSSILSSVHDKTTATSSSEIQLLELYLHYNHCFDHKIMALLVESLRDQPSLEVFSSIDNEFEIPGLQILAGVIPHLPGLKVLRLASTRCSEVESWSEIIKSLPHLPCLKELDLSNNNVGADGASALVTVIRNHGLRSLKRLWLNFCNIRDSRVVLQGLHDIHLCPQLSYISLGTNSLGDTLEGIVDVQFPSGLEYLNLSNNKLSKPVVAHLQEFFKAYPDLNVVFDELAFSVEET